MVNRWRSRLDSHTSSVCGLDFVDYLSVRNNPTSVRKRLALPIGKAFTLVHTVRGGSVQVLLNGETLLDWQQGADRLSLPSFWAMPSTRRLGIGAYASVFRFDQITLEELPSTGEVSQPAETSRLAYPGPANHATNHVPASEKPSGISTMPKEGDIYRVSSTLIAGLALSIQDMTAYPLIQSERDSSESQRWSVKKVQGRWQIHQSTVAQFNQCSSGRGRRGPAADPVREPKR